MTEPIDNELDAVLTELFGSDCMHEQWLREIGRPCARAVLAKWGTPPVVVGEQVGWMWQHDETGRTGFVDCWQVENGWQENNPRLRLVSKLYTTPQPTQAQHTQAQAGAITPPPVECNTEELKKAYAFGWWSALEKQRETVQAGAVPLTDEQIRGFWDGHTVPVFGKTGINPIVFARAIEAAHGIKGGQHGADT